MKAICHQQPAQLLAFPPFLVQTLVGWPASPASVKAAGRIVADQGVAENHFVLPDQGGREAKV